MTLYTYRIPVDDGAAPNPYWGVCTLAICKPAIRRTARRDDWVIGLGAKRSRDGRDHEGTLVCAMQVADVVSFEEYDRCFPSKRPELTSPDWRRWLGDNLYDFSEGYPRQRRGVHSGSLAMEYQARDLSGRNVLISDRFLYCGSNPLVIPPKFDELIFGTRQGHRTWYAEREQRFVAWLQGVDLQWNVAFTLPQLWPFDETPEPSIQCKRIPRRLEGKRKSRTAC